MNYYLLINSININTVGTIPQIVDATNLEALKKNIGFEEGLISLPILPEVMLDSQALLTTFLNGGRVGYANCKVFENSFVDFLKDFKIQETQDWNILAHQDKRSIVGYKLFRICYKNKQYKINYDKSQYYIPNKHNFRSEDVTYLDIRNDQEFRQIFLDLQQKKQNFFPKKITIDLTSVDEDLFLFDHNTFIPNSYIVSRKLKDAIQENEKFTGFRFKEIQDCFPKIDFIC
ncbi:hypothetical protein [uncultured Aquimarina sp.]|uniref:hypothetical protein n=1 Tax=uncultured Aquimarina sp. TaxID=575652 RepID=UPI00261D9C9F|nr:hypothetical protein [uncultured Aquimarina sp.]